MWPRILVVVLGGCGFESQLASGVTPEIDATVEASPDAPPAFCDPADPTLVACYAFEGTTQDGSANQLHASVTNVTFVSGKVGLAMQFGATSAADVADSSAFDVAALTIEAWIQPAQTPATGQRAGIVDVNGQWGMFVHEPSGRLGCSAGGLAQQVDAGISAGTWTHVACTYAAGTLAFYVDGALRSTHAGGGPLATGGSQGLSLAADNPAGAGSRLLGLVDQVRVYARARTAAEICHDAGCPAE